MEHGQPQLNTGKVYFTVEDIMNRYRVGKAKAQNIMRAIKEVCAQGNFSKYGGALGKGRLLPAEIAFWEQYCVQFNRPTEAEGGAAL